MDDEKTGGIKKDFGKIPHWIVDSRVLPRLSGSELKVLFVLIRRAAYTSGNGRVSNKRISKESGVTYSSISKCLKNLEDGGVIKRWRRGWVRFYSINSYPLSSLSTWKEFFSRGDKSPKKSVTYQRDSWTGRFVKKNV